MGKNRYDCIIIGAGPGGLQAAIHLARYNRRVLLLDQGGGRTRHARRLENYLGFEPASGKKLVDIGIRQVKSFGVEFKSEQARSLQAENIFAVNTDQADYQAPYIVVSSGARENHPLIKGMNRFFARTIFTCVDCDGYRTTNKKLVILGDSLEAFRLAFAMKQMFTRDITLILSPHSLPVDHVDLLLEEDIAFVAGKPEEFLGETDLTGIRLADGQEITSEVVMLSYGYTINDSFLTGLPLKRESGSNKLITDHAGESSVKNLFALGALRVGRAQAIIAAGQGAMVGIEINHRLLEL